MDLKHEKYLISKRVILLLLKKIESEEMDFMSPEMQLWGEVKMQNDILK